MGDRVAEDSAEKRDGEEEPVFDSRRRLELALDDDPDDANRAEPIGMRNRGLVPRLAAGSGLNGERNASRAQRANASSDIESRGANFTANMGDESQLATQQTTSSTASSTPSNTYAKDTTAEKEGNIFSAALDSSPLINCSPILVIATSPSH